MTAGPPSESSDTGLIASAEAEVRAERELIAEELGHDAVLWLALVPLWTKSAAEEAGFPVASLIEFIHHARKVGWCETRGSLRDGGAPNLRFWMPDNLRRDVLESQRRRSREVATEIASRIIHGGFQPQKSDPRDEPVIPGALQSWAGLLTSGAAADRQLVESVSQAVDMRDLGRAQELIAAGEALAALLTDTMALAVDRARRLLSLGRRRRMDAADLEHYLDRPELSGAVDRLLTRDTDQWALHLRGVGGVGKTMLIKYLASDRYAVDRKQDPIPVARVDFDYMSPDYPVRRPVQLLLELADELSLRTARVAAADSGLDRFRATATSTHEAFSGARTATPSVTRNERVLLAVDAFADVLARFPRVLLILDTCEELAKFDAGDPAVPTVATTLEILERIHERAPSVRVLFAGRRPLPVRDYLTVQPVISFTIGEAQRYLASYSDPPISDDLAAEIIRQSPAVDARNRISPFDLALYRSWADENPGLTAQQVARGSDAYIEGRIIERLGDGEGDVLRALPVLATAGRCRVATLATFLDVAPESLGVRLAAQEWIDADGDPPEHVAAKPALARRLWHYFTAEDRAEEFTAEMTRLATALRAHIADAPFSDIDRDEVMAALRLSAAVDAVKLWDALAERAKNAHEWDWIRNVTDHIRGEWEEDEWQTTLALRASVVAAHIASTRRVNPSFDARTSWAEVSVAWQSHPDNQMGQALHVRAVAGLLRYTPGDASLWQVLQTGVVSGPEVEAAVADLANHLLEMDMCYEAGRVLARGKFGSPEAAAWAEIARARLLSDSNPAEAQSAVIRAGDLALVPGGNTREFFDWIRPDDLLARVWIEWGLITPPDEDMIASWETYAEAHFTTIEAERLASQCLRIRLSRGVIDRSDIGHWESIDRYEHAWQPTCSAHDLVPPLFVTLAEAWLAAGEPRRSLDLLDRRRSAALSTRSDEVTIRHADTETIRIARRFRLEHKRSLISRMANSGNDDARRAMAVVFGEIPADLTVQIMHDLAPTDLTAPIMHDARLIPARRIRSADPFRDIRVAMRLAIRAREPYEPPQEIPKRLFAEMAFDEAELLQLPTVQTLIPGGEARAFGYAHAAYAACGDRVGQVLAANASTMTTRRSAHGDAVVAALGLLRRTYPDTWAALTGDPDQAGPWRYWATVVQRSAPTAVSPSSAESLQRRFTQRHFRLRRRTVITAVVRGSDRPGNGRLDLSTERFTGRSRYRGTWSTTSEGAVVLKWWLDGPPDMTYRGWQKRVKRGTILTDPSDAPLPWERILTVSFRPRAAARVVWYRWMSIPVRAKSEGPVNHVLGRAIRTSAGPRLDLGVDSASGAHLLYGSAELGMGAPVLIVLQAEPVAEEAEALAGDDLQEKLALAVDLIQGGVTLAVLIVPAIPVAQASAVAETIGKHAAKRHKKPLRLQMDLRKMLEPHVSPALLDDLVLFLNEGATRE